LTTTEGLPGLYSALHDVISQYPSLAVGIVDDSTPSASFVRLSSIDLRRVVHITNFPMNADETTRSRILNETIQARLSARFSDLATLPLWRLVIFQPDPSDEDQSIDVALFVHHGIADGTSAVIVIQALRDALNAHKQVNREEEETKYIFTPLMTSNLLPPLEILHPLPVSWTSLLYAVWRGFFPASRDGLWTGQPITRPNDCLESRHTFRIVPAAQVSRLLAACRTHGTTLTPLLEVLAARALFAVLPSTGDSAAKVLKGVTPINLRAFMAPKYKDAMGVFIASSETMLSRDEVQDDVWAEASRVSRSLAHTLDDIKQNRHVNTGMYRYAGDIRAFLEKPIGQPREISFEVSNTGAIDGVGEAQKQDVSSSSTPWRISRLMFSQGGAVVGAAVQFNVGSVRGGPLTISAGWQKGVVEDTIVEAAVDKLVSVINDVCSGRL
jgi:hypothetical protein